MNEKRPYLEICNDIGKISSAKEARALHKELKQYGDGLPMFMRYPNVPIIVSAVALVGSMAAVVLRLYL